MSDGSLRRVSLAELDKMVDARRYPADFWACVHAADRLRDHLGESEEPQLTSWPNGTSLGPR